MEDRWTRLGARLAEAWQNATTLDEFADADRPASRTEAYAVQDAMAEALGEPITGWKVGATSSKMRELDGHDDVIPGRMFASTTTLGNDVELRAKRYPHSRVETEFAFRLTDDIPLRDTPWTIDELKDKVTFHPALEIIGNRYPKGDGAPHVGTLETIADNGGGIGFVFGDEVADWQALDYRDHRIALTVDDGEPAENFLGEYRCVPIEAVADLVNHLRSRGIGMKAGEFISTGAATVPQHVSRGSVVSADFGSLGHIRLRLV